VTLVCFCSIAIKPLARSVWLSTQLGLGTDGSVRKWNNGRWEDHTSIEPRDGERRRCRSRNRNVPPTPLPVEVKGYETGEKPVTLRLVTTLFPKQTSAVPTVVEFIAKRSKSHRSDSNSISGAGALLSITVHRFASCTASGKRQLMIQQVLHKP
jgi:hypothetical protein